jgi:hypothetical protein
MKGLELSGLGFTAPSSLTYWDGLSLWQSPLGAAGMVPNAVGMIGSTTAYSMGVLTPLLAVVGLFLISGSGGGGSYYGRRRK